MRKLALIFAVICVIPGCAVYTPSGAIVVDPHHGDGGGGHCPPGQAKKGNC